MIIAWWANYFISTWKTDNPWASANNQITVPMQGGTYVVHRWDWTSSVWVSWFQTHTYANPWVYTIKIRWNNLSIKFNNTWDRQKILSVDQWGIEWASFDSAFYWCSNLQLIATDIPKWPFTDMSRMFWSCWLFTWNPSMANWDVSNVTDFFQMFLSDSAFNQDISSWDTSSAISMSGMFANATSFNQPIGSRDVSNVQTIEQMFQWASAFNQPLNSWNTSSMTNIRQAFSSASSFNQPLNNWNVSNVTTMRRLFYLATLFNQPLDNWNVSNVVNMEWMFVGSSFNQDISSWNVISVTDMTIMLQCPISVANYNALLIARSWLALQIWVTLDVSQNYNFWAPEAARLSIIGSYSWTINDLGPI